MADESQTSDTATTYEPSRFADSIQQLLGADFDPDPLFLEESWTLGIPTAAENLYYRHQQQAEYERENPAFREFDTQGTLLFVEDDEHAVESLLAGRAAAIASSYDSNRSQDDAQPGWTPKDWAPDDRITQAWIPKNWMPEGVPQQEAPQPEAEPVSQPWQGMALSHARQLLGVTVVSTRKQIRSAYRQLVGKWHPDQMQGASEAVRERATQQMAAINEAYRLLCRAQQSAA